MSTSISNETYAQWLERQMKERGFSTRSLARVMNPEDPEVARRALRRYLSGMVPQARTRVAIAEALGSAESEPPSSDDDKGGSLLAALRSRLHEVELLADDFETLLRDRERVPA
jgi:hypothetical protein